MAKDQKDTPTTGGPHDPQTKDVASDPTATSATDQHGATAPGEAAGTPFTQQVGRIVLVVVAVLFGVFAVFNAHYVDFNWIFGETQVRLQGGERVGGGIPLIVLLVLAFVMGAVVGWMATWWRGRRQGSAPRE